MGPAVHALDTWGMERIHCDCGQKPRAECVTFSFSHTADIHWLAPSPQHVCYSPQVWEQESLDRTKPGKRKENSQICTSLKSSCETHLIRLVFVPSCRQTPSWQKDETGRARTCSSGVCDNLSCSSDFWRRCDPICEVSEHTAPHLDLQQYRCLQEVNTGLLFKNNALLRFSKQHRNWYFIT